MGVLPFEYLMFFPFMDTPCSLSRMIEVLKEKEECSSWDGIAVTSSRRGSVMGFFLNRWSFSHFNWIPHEFSVFSRDVFSSNYEQLFMCFLLIHSESHTLTLSSGSIFLKTHSQSSVSKLPIPQNHPHFSTRRENIPYFFMKKNVFILSGKSASHSMHCATFGFFFTENKIIYINNFFFLLVDLSKMYLDTF